MNNKTIKLHWNCYISIESSNTGRKVSVMLLCDEQTKWTRSVKSRCSWHEWLYSSVGGVPAGAEALRSALSGEEDVGSTGRQPVVLHSQDGWHLHLDPPREEGSVRQDEAPSTHATRSQGTHW